MTDQPNSNDGMAPAPEPPAEAPLGSGWLQQDGVLRDLWMQNKTPQEISEVLGRSVPAIMTRAARLGLPRRSAPGRKPGSVSTRRLPSHDDMRAASMPQRAAAQSTGESKEAISQASLRVCLMCLRKFESAGRHNRICMPCKGSAEYSQASALPDIHLPQA